MHISNDRYFDDRRRHDLALRMIRHEARTCTIRACTGLTDDRIRRLYQAYAAQCLTAPMRRRRGKSPRQVAFFTRSTQAQFEASLLAGTFVALGLLAQTRPATPKQVIHRGTLLCDAYETHLQLLPDSSISFEHAWFLLQLLTRNAELNLVRCRHCDGQFLHARTGVLRRGCPACTLTGTASRPARLRQRRAASSTAVGDRRPPRGVIADTASAAMRPALTPAATLDG